MAILPPGDDLNIKVDNVKNGKAAWVDGIPPERLKYGGEEMLNTCINYLSKFWTAERISTEWNKGLLVKLP